MNWDWVAIEAIASIIGGLGVIASIIFLIYEVRHNARAIEGATVQSLMSLEREVFSLLADNADLMTKGGTKYKSLTKVEVYKYERMVGSYMSLIYSAFVQNEGKLVDDDVWAAYLNALSRHMEAPGFFLAWDKIKDGYPESFLNALAQRLKE